MYLISGQSSCTCGGDPCVCLAQSQAAQCFPLVASRAMDAPVAPAVGCSCPGPNGCTCTL